MGSLRSSALAMLAPAVLTSPVFVESAAPSSPTLRMFDRQARDKERQSASAV